MSYTAISSKLLQKGGVVVASFSYLYNSNSNIRRTKNEEASLNDEKNRFMKTLAYHRNKRNEYLSKWNNSDRNTINDNISLWPKEIPNKDELPSLEFDLKLCKRSPNFRDQQSYCDAIQFQIASTQLYASSAHAKEEEEEGLIKMKDLAERGNPNGMLGYGIALMEGKANLESNPQQAIGWFRRCIELDSIESASQAMYELGVALYLGEGVVENETQAAKYFHVAANKGNVAAAYLYGECLLSGSGVKRDRSAALTWLVKAAVQGHVMAQRRVLDVLDHVDFAENITKVDIRQRKKQKEQVYETDEDELDREEEIILARMQWGKDKVAIEKRYTIGGSSPATLARRRTAVQESRHASS